MKNLITPSIEKRAIELIIKGVDPIEAVKQALLDEMNLIGSLLTSGSKLTERGQLASTYLFNKNYKKLCR